MRGSELPPAVVVRIAGFGCAFLLPGLLQGRVEMLAHLLQEAADNAVGLADDLASDDLADFEGGARVGAHLVGVDLDDAVLARENALEQLLLGRLGLVGRGSGLCAFHVFLLEGAGRIVARMATIVERYLQQNNSFVKEGSIMMNFFGTAGSRQMAG